MKESLKRISNFKKLQANSQVLAQKMTVFMQRFEIGNVLYSEEFLKTKEGKFFQVQVADQIQFASSEKEIICISESGQMDEYWKEGKRFFLSISDLYEVLHAPDEKFDEMPELLNTLENCYRKITVVGDSEYAKQIFRYFNENKDLESELLSTESIQWNGKCYVIPHKKLMDEVIFFADLYAEASAIDCDGKHLLTVFVKRIYRNNIKTIENMTDVDENIIPRLVAGGVHVIKLYVPDVNRIPNAAQVKANLTYWNVMRHFWGETFRKKRAKIEHTEYLKDELAHLTNDNSKGYSQMHGNGTFVNFDNGFRRTVGNNFYAKRKVFFFGPCFIRGLTREDSKTIPSMVKGHLPEEYMVLNYGSEFSTCGYIMRSLEYKKGDIVVLFSPDAFEKRRLINQDITEIDLTEFYKQIPNVQKHVFDLLLHFDMFLQEQMVEQLMPYINRYVTENLKEADVVDAVTFGPKEKRAPGLQFCKDEAFKSWLMEQVGRFPYTKGVRGAIVMNCNPFTLGHRYLIEFMSKKVDELFIFVVQEDKSVFPFADRMELVKKGTEDLGNVCVLPSGSYMISSNTLPGYFSKDQLADCSLDASQDLMLFVQIAKALHITVRFAGEEPLDRFTRMYNDNMRAILPKYGIAFEAIARKESDGEVISASRVRAALKSKDWETIQRIVPKTTYCYLQEKFG